MRLEGLRSHLLPFAGWEYWEERLKLTVKSVLAAVVAWLMAKHLAGHPEPYFAPLAALLGVYPTVARSIKESLAYGAGFALGAAIAIPVGLLVGATTLGIAVVLFVGMMIAGWRRLGDQSPQVAFTALFALLFGGHEVVGYVLPRLGDVMIGLVVGLAVNSMIFPPLYLRMGEYAVGRMRVAMVEAMRVLADYVAEPGDRRQEWEQSESELLSVQGQTRYAVEQGQASLSANLRAKWWGYRLRRGGAGEQWGTPAQLITLENAMSYTRSIASTMLLAMEEEDEERQLDPAFLHDYSAHLRVLAELTDHLPEAPNEETLAEAERMQDALEEPHLGPGTDVPGLWDPEKELVRLSRLLLEQVCGRQV